MRIAFPYIALILMTILTSCAQFGTPQGGPKDVDPPYMIKELSEKNFQTNFSKREFQLSFNEWIQLSKPAQEIVISPPTNYPIQTNIKGKSVVISFHEEEILKEDITYQINFGDALRDFTESNIYKNLVFVFATGDKIDSLSVSGTVTDAVDGKPRKDILVCLHENLNDSALVLHKPFYFTRTDKSGRYKLSNLKADTFQVFALLDENVNYIFDLSSEQAGFRDQPIILRDSNLINIDLEVFDEEDEPRLVSYRQDKKGLITAELKPKAKDISLIIADQDSIYSFVEYNKDSLYIWHNDMRSDSSRFILQYAGRSDTIINKKARQSIAGKILKFDPSIKSSISVNPLDSLRIAFNKPLRSIDSLSLQMKDSSFYLTTISKDVENRDLILKYVRLENEKNYELLIVPGSVEDIYGTRNKDSLKLEIKTIDPKQLGNISLNYINTSDTSYIVQFLRAENIIKEDVIDSTITVKFNKLQKGTYKLKIIEDLNNDGKWTGGSVILKRKPEKIRELSLEELKPGWDLDLDIKIKEIFYGTPIE